MDLHKHFREAVTNRQERDEAQALLRRIYSQALSGSDFESLARDLHCQAESEAGSESVYELWEIEGRGVATVWPDEGFGLVWVWDGHAWRIAPGLVNKSWVEGHRLSTVAFVREFPDADLGEVEVLVQEALGGVRR